MDGAIQFTRIEGASSAANDRLMPSIAPLVDDTTAWNENPACTATVENKTTEG
jgi:hypothetical protein